MTMTSLLSASLVDRNLLLLGRGELAVRFGLCAQALDRVHHVRLLRQHRIAELLRPIEILVHHVEHGRRRHERLHARVPILLGESLVELVALQRCIGFGEAVGLHHLERIGRGHQHLREQGVGIERDRRDKRVELALAEGLLFGGGGLRAGRRLVRGKSRPREKRRDDCDCESSRRTALT